LREREKGKRNEERKRSGYEFILRKMRFEREREREIENGRRN